ncbi:MAG: PAS domain-containing protein, partial [Cytophagaceae bacterium]
MVNPIAILAILDVKGSILELNRVWESILGWKNSVVSGAPIVNYIRLEDQHAFTSAFQCALQKIARRETLQFQDRSGEWITAEFHIFFDENQNTVVMIGRPPSANAILSTSESNPAYETAREFVQAILDAIPDPVFVKDQEHRWIFGNEAFSQLLGK